MMIVNGPPTTQNDRLIHIRDAILIANACDDNNVKQKKKELSLAKKTQTFGISCSWEVGTTTYT